MNKGLHFKFDVHISPNLLKGAVVACLLALPAAEISSESVNLITSYPAPSGVYTRLITTSDARLARDGGHVAIGGQPGTAKLSVMGGRVGVGTVSPTAALEIVDGSDANGVNLRSNAKIEAGSGVYLNSSRTQYIAPVGSDLGIYNGGLRMTVSNLGNVAIGGAPSGFKLDVNGTMVVRGNGCGMGQALSYTGADNDCAGGQSKCCPSGTYATWATGIMSKYQTGSQNSSLGGTMFCCPCPGGVCPSL